MEIRWGYAEHKDRILQKTNLWEKKTKGNCGLQTQADFSSPLMNDSNSNILNGSHDPKSEHQTK